MFPDGAGAHLPPACWSQFVLRSHWMLVSEGHPTMHMLDVHSQTTVIMFLGMRPSLLTSFVEKRRTLLRVRVAFFTLRKIISLAVAKR